MVEAGVPSSFKASRSRAHRGVDPVTTIMVLSVGKLCIGFS